MRHLSLLLAVCVVCSSSVQGSNWMKKYEDGLKGYSEESLAQEFPEKIRPQNYKHPLFRCPDMSPSSSVPTSVQRVKPADIKVIAALGDSLTTAIGANASSILGIPNEYRQVSWSIGGYGTYQDVITLANIVKLFNPNVIAPALKRTVNGKPATLKETGFNLAVTGHNTYEFTQQTRHLIDTLKNYPGLSFEEDWKLLTILIGNNDICDYCKNKTLYSADSFIHNLTVALDMLYNEIPRMIVNLVEVLDMEGLREVNDGSIGCLLQRSFCSCLVRPDTGSPELEELIELNHEFQRRMEQLIGSGRYNKDDFSVVLQPYLKKAKPPKDESGKVDYSFFAPDCFHFSIKGHEELAKGLWNNMFQPDGEKFEIENFSEPIELICPPEDHPYIYTTGHVRNTASVTQSSVGQI
nr:PREDICTED: phospholipase B1, membrane-associated-like [Lepisosteus oculatus]